MERRRPAEIATSFLTLFGLGRLPLSASVAALLAPPFYVALGRLPLGSLANWLSFGLLLAAGVIAASVVADSPAWDPRRVVVDEFLGMYLALLLAGTTDLVAVAVLFGAFRVLDILKPAGLRRLERLKRHAVLADDLAIGAFVGTVLLLVLSVSGWEA